MSETPLALAPLDAFPAPDPQEWSARVHDELEGQPLDDLRRPDGTGLARDVLDTARDLPREVPLGRRLERGWLSVEEWSAAQAESDDAWSEDRDAWAFQSERAADPPVAPDRTLLASHTDAERAASRPYAVGGFDPLGAAARDGAASEAELRATLARTPVALSGTGRPLRVDVGAHHRAGAHPVQELAFAFATLAEAVRAGDAARVAAGTALAFEVGRDVFDELAKLRAARALWARFFGAAGLRDVPPAWILATTSGRALEVAEPLGNVVRATTQTFAAVVGGADAVCVRPHDAALGEPSPLGRRLARNVQRILRHEAQLARVADAAGGSYLVEQRTDAFARAAWDELRALEGRGGMLRELCEGRVRAAVDRAWLDWSARVASGAEHVVGVTLHPTGGAASDPPPPRSAPAAEVAPLPARRDGAAARPAEVAR